MSDSEECLRPDNCCVHGPGTVEDSHAALAKEMRQTLDEFPRRFDAWADRVEQLGQNFASALKEHDSEFRQRRILEEQRAAREAEIAKVREEMLAVAPLMHQVRKETIREWAARLGGAT